MRGITPLLAFRASLRRSVDILLMRTAVYHRSPLRQWQAPNIGNRLLDGLVWYKHSVWLLDIYDLYFPLSLHCRFFSLCKEKKAQSISLSGWRHTRFGSE